MVIGLDFNKDKYLEHIKDKNQILNMRKLLDKIEITLNKYQIQITDFMDPYEIRLSKSILNRFTYLEYCEIGGIEEAERKIIIIYPQYIEIEDVDSFIAALSMEWNSNNLSHRDFLGGILNLGINRNKVGDILIHEGYAQVIVKREVADFILTSLDRIGNQKVKVRQIPIDELKAGQVDYIIKRTVLSSLRLDVLISGAYNLSRNDSQSLIVAQRVKVNWEPVDKVSKEVKQGDMISVKGYGRFILSAIEGISKKGRIKVELKLLI